MPQAIKRQGFLTFLESVDIAITAGPFTRCSHAVAHLRWLRRKFPESGDSGIRCIDLTADEYAEAEICGASLDAAAAPTVGINELLRRLREQLPDYGSPMPPPDSTREAAGTRGKVAALELRATFGFGLWHSSDPHGAMDTRKLLKSINDNGSSTELQAVEDHGTADGALDDGALDNEEEKDKNPCPPKPKDNRSWRQWLERERQRAPKSKVEIIPGRDGKGNTAP